MEERYCIECGACLTPDATFCPSCGAMAGPASDFTPDSDILVNSNTVHQTPQRSNNRLTIAILCLIWGFLAAILGFMLQLNAESMANDAIEQLKGMVYSDTQSYWDVLVESGFGKDLLLDVYHIFGISFILSGLMALVTAYFVYSGTHYRIALLTLILSSLLGALQVIPLIIGLIVTYMLTKHKVEFIS